MYAGNIIWEKRPGAEQLSDSQLLCFSPFLAPADYIGSDMNINLASEVGLPGQMRFCQNIVINDDNFAEGNEEFNVNLFSLSSLVTVNPQSASATVEIVDDDSRFSIII